MPVTVRDFVLRYPRYGRTRRCLTIVERALIKHELRVLFDAWVRELPVIVAATWIRVTIPREPEAAVSDPNWVHYDTDDGF